MRDDEYQCTLINTARRVMDAHIVSLLYVIETGCDLTHLIDKGKCPEMLKTTDLPPHEDTLPDLSDRLQSVWVPNARTLHRKRSGPAGDPTVPYDEFMRVLLTKSVPRRCYQRNFSQVGLFITVFPVLTPFSRTCPNYSTTTPTTAAAS